MPKQGALGPPEVVYSFQWHWALSQQEHKLSGEWARLAGPVRGALDAGLLKLVKAGKNKKGSWLKAQIYAAIKEAHGADAKSPTIDQVCSVLPDVLRREILNQKSPCTYRRVPFQFFLSFPFYSRFTPKTSGINGGINMADREGFEPSLHCCKHAFQACAFDHSATCPLPPFFRRGASLSGAGAGCKEEYESR